MSKESPVSQRLSPDMSLFAEPTVDIDSTLHIARVSRDGETYQVHGKYLVQVKRPATTNLLDTPFWT